MKTTQTQLRVQTRGKGFVDVTEALQRLVAESSLTQGVCNVFMRHTSASLTIQENADPAVLRDLERWLSELAPESRRWEHSDEGADDMPAHARSALTHTSETITISSGRLALGTWQAVYVWEHRARPHERTLVVTLLGT